MPWSIEEIERDWMNGESLGSQAEEILAAFETAERVRGLEWIQSTRLKPGGVTIWGFTALLPILALAERISSLRNAVGADDLLQRLRRNDAAAESELSAIHLLRSSNLETELEIAPIVTVGSRQRRPDFSIRRPADVPTIVEVTALHQSNDQMIAQQILQTVVGEVMAIERAFFLEIVFWRSPTDAEVQELVDRVRELCSTLEPCQDNHNGGGKRCQEQFSERWVLR